MIKTTCRKAENILETKILVPLNPKMIGAPWAEEWSEPASWMAGLEPYE